MSIGFPLIRKEQKENMSTPPQRYLNCISTAQDDWTSFWFDQIGWLGYFFSQLEWCTFWLADRIGSEEQKTVICKKRFVERCNYAVSDLVPRLDESALRTEWSVFLVEAAKSAAMRNKILHNPLDVNIREMQSNGVSINQGIRLLREKGGEILGLGDVQQFTNTIRDLNFRMIDLMERTVLSTRFDG